MRSRFVFVAVLLTFLLCLCQVHAGVLYDNTTLAGAQDGTSYHNYAIGAGQAQRFHTDVSFWPQWTVILSLTEVTNGSTLSVQVYGDNGMPSDPEPNLSIPIVTLVGPAGGFNWGTTEYYTFAPSVPTVLGPSTEYWIVATVTSGSVNWTYTSDNTIRSENGPGYELWESYYSGGTWSGHSYDSSPYVMQLSSGGGQVPEPSTLLLIPAGLLLFWRRLRK